MQICNLLFFRRNFISNLINVQKYNIQTPICQYYKMIEIVISQIIVVDLSFVYLPWGLL
jgi:hypothetical protein